MRSVLVWLVIMRWVSRRVVSAASMLLLSSMCLALSTSTSGVLYGLVDYLVDYLVDCLVNCLVSEVDSIAF